MSASVASLDGIPLVGNVAWAITAGIAPYQTIVTVHHSEGDRLLDKLGKPVRLEFGGGSGGAQIGDAVGPGQGSPDMDGSGGGAGGIVGGIGPGPGGSVDGIGLAGGVGASGGCVVEKVYIVSEVGQPSPYLRAFLVADGRWLWQRKFVRRDYNFPRKRGDKHILDGTIPDLAQVTDHYTYAPWSLYNGDTKWDATRVLLDVLTRVHGDEVALLFSPSRSLPIEHLCLRDGGGVAMGRALANIPGADVYIDYKGRACVWNRNDLAATKAAVEKLPPPTVMGGILTESKQKAIRPKWVDVYLEREVELRYDSLVEGTSGESLTVAGGDSTSFIENVMPLPDLELTINGRKVYRGTWVALADVVPVYAAELAATGLGGPELTIDNIRKFWFQGMWTAWTELGKRVPDVDFVARISAIRQHFRRTYRISRLWMDRIKNLRATRVGVIDDVTGTRAPALVETDYCVQPSDAVKARPDWVDRVVWMNVEGYPDDGLISTGKLSPVVVRVLDEDLGVIHLDYHLDPYGNVAAIHPGLVGNSAGEVGAPCHDFRKHVLKDHSPIVDGKIKNSNGGYQLISGHRVLVVLTAVPGAPNNEKAMHRIRVTPSDVADMLPGVTVDGDGPPWEITVPASTYTARFIWDDEENQRSGVYSKLFGFGVANPDDAGIDPDEVRGEIWQNSKECKNLAKAAAASIYAKMADHFEGGQAHHLTSDMEPVGNLVTIVQRLDADGRQVTAIEIPPELAPIDVFALLDSNTRATILGLVTLKQGP